MQAATAATTPGTAKPDDKKTAADAKLVTVVTDVKTDDKKDEAVDDKKFRMARKVFVVVGVVHEFDSVNKAEKFLNAEGSPSDYTVLRGNRIGTSKKVSLR